MKTPTAHLVFGIYSGIVSDDYLYFSPASARTRRSKLRKHCGFASGKPGHAEHEVKRFEVLLEIPGEGGPR
jgi:hypothetical protein